MGAASFNLAVAVSPLRPIYRVGFGFKATETNETIKDEAQLITAIPGFYDHMSQ